jgi:beta-glucosidase
MSEVPLFNDPGKPLDARIDALLAQLSTSEKLRMFTTVWPSIDRLGLPGVRWGGECLHGLCHTGRATVFPIPLAMAATFDPSLVRRVADAIATEARAKINDPVWRDNPYLSLAFWTPNINLFRDPRWGRGQETFGEDPFLTGEMGLAFVRGLQGDDPHYLKTAACAKHFAVHSGPEAIRTSFDAKVSPKLLHETYLPHFKRLVGGGVAVVMGAYNALNGDPCCGSILLLEDCLREAWGFDGFVVSDAGAIAACHRRDRSVIDVEDDKSVWGFLDRQMAELVGHGKTRDAVESAALALNGGCDMSIGDDLADKNLEAALQRGLLTMDRVDTALRRILSVAFRLGVYDAPQHAPFRDLDNRHIQCPQHLALAREAAARSCVLLKNNGILPLRPDVESIAVSGPTAADVEVLLGNFYRGVSANLRTILEGIVAAAPDGTRINYLKGCELYQDNLFDSTWSIGLAEQADVIVAVMGNSPLMEGEHGECIGTRLGGDRDRLDLPQVQVNHLRKLKALRGKPLIVIVTSGSPILLAEVHELADAILLAWYPGEQGGDAVGEILFGQRVPGGRLPVTFPADASHIPAFEDYSMVGRTHRYSTHAPLYPFGFGLGFSRVVYSDFRLESNVDSGGDPTLNVRFRISNAGPQPAVAAPQLYLSDASDDGGPTQNLRAFQSHVLAAGQSMESSFHLTASDFSHYDAVGRIQPGTGPFTIRIGEGAHQAKSEELGAPKGWMIQLSRRPAFATSKTTQSDQHRKSGPSPADLPTPISEETL